MDANLLDCVISFKKDVNYEVTVSRPVKRPVIAIAITPDRKDWHAVEQAPQPAGPIVGNAATTVAPITKPPWAS